LLHSSVYSEGADRCFTGESSVQAEENAGERESDEVYSPGTMMLTTSSFFGECIIMMIGNNNQLPPLRALQNVYDRHHTLSLSLSLLLHYTMLPQTVNAM
jgi:hypothetical protein